MTIVQKVALIAVFGFSAVAFAGIPCPNPLSPTVTQGSISECTSDVLLDGGCVSPGNSAFKCKVASGTITLTIRYMYPSPMGQQCANSIEKDVPAHYGYSSVHPCCYTTGT